MDSALPARCDLLVIGGGINGVGIARDATGRGLSVVLLEKDDLASHTSSASTKLIHGGLRYLEYRELRLVREALVERERLLAVAPHIIWPLRFVLPASAATRSRWLIRAGLFLYDHLGGRKRLPASQGVKLGADSAYGAALRPGLARGFVYSDCWVDDARLVALNAVDARARGATILTRTAFAGATRDGDGWRVRLGDGRTVRAGALVNAAGPWVGRALAEVDGIVPERPPRLVKGSHIVVPRAYDGDHCYILQNDDRRIVFTIPYERDFTLIGTTDVDWTGDPGAPRITRQETDYLCESASAYLARPVRPEDVVHSYSGVRPLYDDGASDAQQVTRDYVLRLGTEDGPQLLSVFGGKITTYRRLAEHALAKLAPFLPTMGGPWTATAPLPGGDMPDGDFARFLAAFRADHPFLPGPLAHRLARAYGTTARMMLAGATALADLGEDLGGGLTAREVDHLVTAEFARTAEDVLWRRTKLGLHLDAHAADRVSAYLARHHG